MLEPVTQQPDFILHGTQALGIPLVGGSHVVAGISQPPEDHVSSVDHIGRGQDVDPLAEGAETGVGESRLGRVRAVCRRTGTQDAEQVLPGGFQGDQVVGVQGRSEFQQARNRIPVPAAVIGQRSRTGTEQNTHQGSKRR